MAAAVASFSALYTEMSDHPDTTSLETEFAEKVLANPVIQVLIAEEPIPITAGTRRHIPFINYTRAVRDGHILPSLAPFSIEQLTEAIGLLEFWQFPDSNMTEPSNSPISVFYWKDVLTQERDIRTLATAAAPLPKSLHPLLEALAARAYSYFRLPLRFPDILGLHGYSNRMVDALLGRADSPVYNSNKILTLPCLEVLCNFAMRGDIEMMEWACQSEEIRESLPGVWTLQIARASMHTDQPVVLDWLCDAASMMHLIPGEAIATLMSEALNLYNAPLSIRWFCTLYPTLMTPELFREAIWNCPAALKELIAAGCPWSVSVCHEAIRYGDPDIIKTLRDAGCPWAHPTASDGSDPLFQRGDDSYVPSDIEAEYEGAGAAGGWDEEDEDDYRREQALNDQIDYYRSHYRR